MAVDAMNPMSAPPLSLFTVMVTSRDAEGRHEVLSAVVHVDREEAEADTRHSISRLMGDGHAHFVFLLESSWGEPEDAEELDGWRARRRAVHDLSALRDLEALCAWMERSRWKEAA